MSTKQVDPITKVAEELYEANRQTYVQELSRHIDQRIQSGMDQVRNEEIMDEASFNKKVMNIALK